MDQTIGTRNFFFLIEVSLLSWRMAWQATPVFLPGGSPWTEETGRLQPMGSQRAGHGSATKQHEVSGTKLDTEDEMVAE